MAIDMSRRADNGLAIEREKDAQAPPSGEVETILKGWDEFPSLAQLGSGTPPALSSGELENLLKLFERWVHSNLSVSDNDKAAEYEWQTIKEYIRSLQAQNTLLTDTVEKQRGEMGKMKAAVEQAKSVLESFDNTKGGYNIPHSEYCMSQRTEVQDDMVTYGHGAMDVCNCYLNEVIEAVESCDEVLFQLSE